MMFTPRPKGLGRDNFLKINDGEEITGLFKGDIHTFKRHWQQATSRSVECIGADCPICKADPEKYPSFRFRINFITSKDGKWTAKIFEGGGELYDQLVTLDKKFDLSKTVVDIARSGLKQNTKYFITPRSDMPISKEMGALIAKTELLPLSMDDADEKEPGAEG